MHGLLLQHGPARSPPRRAHRGYGDAILRRTQLHNSGVGVGDYVHMQGEYGDHGIFDAYQVNVIDDVDDNDSA